LHNYFSMSFVGLPLETSLGSVLGISVSSLETIIRSLINTIEFGRLERTVLFNVFSTTYCRRSWQLHAKSPDSGANFCFSFASQWSVNSCEAVKVLIVLKSKCSPLLLLTRFLGMGVFQLHSPKTVRTLTPWNPAGPMYGSRDL
jgi:hypothetical protein